jgi:glycosyltransferase involved in cell wall biosynthesis
MNQLIWHGPFAGQSGYEVITRGMLLALDKLGVKIALDESSSWNRERIILDEDVEQRFQRMMQTKVQPNTIAIMHQRKQSQLTDRLSGGKKFVYTLFETDRLPSPWLEELREMDGIFTFSNFNKEMWVKNSGFDASKIHVLPWGVEKEFTLEGPKAKLLNKKGFTFIGNGDFTERKNFEVLIEAYTKEFKANEDVCLILKTHYGGFTKQHRLRTLQRLKKLSTLWVENPPKILFFGEKVTVEDIANLYRACDCLVLPSRGEGLGLPVIEAMACGLPIIATNWSSLAELDFEGWKLSYELAQIDSVEYIRKCPEALNHKWASVDVDDLRRAMRKMFEDREDSKTKGLANAQKVAGRTWHDAAVELLKAVFKGEGGQQ